MNIIFRTPTDETTAPIDTNFLYKAGEVFDDFDESNTNILNIVERLARVYADDFSYEDFNLIEVIGDWNCMDEKQERTGKENIRIREYMNEFFNNIDYTVTISDYTFCIHDESGNMKDWYIDFDSEEALDKGYYFKSYVFSKA